LLRIFWIAAARSAYSPPGARAQIFVSVAELKIAAAYLGAASAGVLSSLSPRVLLLAGAALTVATVAFDAADGRLSRRMLTLPPGNGTGSRRGRERGRAK
jgi:hypothetical protein